MDSEQIFEDAVYAFHSHTQTNVKFQIHVVGYIHVFFLSRKLGTSFSAKICRSSKDLAYGDSMSLVIKTDSGASG